MRRYFAAIRGDNAVNVSVTPRPSATEQSLRVMTRPPPRWRGQANTPSTYSVLRTG